MWSNCVSDWTWQHVHQQHFCYSFDKIWKWPEVTDCYHHCMMLSVPKVWTTPSPPCSLLYSVIQEWLIRASDSTISAQLLRKEGTDPPLIRTFPPTKGIFLMSRKHCFLIRDLRPISQKHKGNSCDEKFGTHATTNIKQLTMTHNHMSRQDLAYEIWSRNHKSFNSDHVFLLVCLKKPHSDQLSELKSDGWSWPCCWGIQLLIDW